MVFIVNPSPLFRFLVYIKKIALVYKKGQMVKILLSWID